MSDEPSRSLATRPSGELTVAAKLAERTLSERARKAALASPGARTLVVGAGGYATINDAVAAAMDGDTVEVRSGTYRGSVTISKSITVAGTGERDSIVVENGDAPCFLLTGATLRLANLSIRGGGVEVRDRAIATLDNLEIADYEGKGVGISGLATVAIVSLCLVHRGSGKSIGVDVRDGASATLERNTISGNAFANIQLVGADTTAEVRGNSVNAGNFGVVIREDATGTIEDNDMFSNDTGIVIGVTDPIVRRNTIHGGEHGIHVWDAAAGTIEDNDIFDNANTGVLIAGAGTGPMLRHNTIRGGEIGVGIGDGATATLEDNDVFGNATAGVMIFGDGPDPILRRNAIHEQEVGVGYGDGAAATLEDNDLFGNATDFLDL